MKEFQFNEYSSAQKRVGARGKEKKRKIRSQMRKRGRMWWMGWLPYLKDCECQD